MAVISRDDAVYMAKLAEQVRMRLGRARAPLHRTPSRAPTLTYTASFRCVAFAFGYRASLLALACRAGRAL